MKTSCTNAYARPYAVTPPATQNSGTEPSSEAARNVPNPIAENTTGNRSFASKRVVDGEWWLRCHTIPGPCINHRWVA